LSHLWLLTFQHLRKHNDGVHRDKPGYKRETIPKPKRAFKNRIGRLIRLAGIT